MDFIICIIFHCIACSLFIILHPSPPSMPYHHSDDGRPTHRHVMSLSLLAPHVIGGASPSTPAGTPLILRAPSRAPLANLGGDPPPCGVATIMINNIQGPPRGTGGSFGARGSDFRRLPTKVGAGTPDRRRASPRLGGSPRNPRRRHPRNPHGPVTPHRWGGIEKEPRRPPGNPGGRGDALPIKPPRVIATLGPSKHPQTGGRRTGRTAIAGPQRPLPGKSLTFPAAWRPSKDPWGPHPHGSPGMGGHRRSRTALAEPSETPPGGIPTLFRRPGAVGRPPRDRGDPWRFGKRGPRGPLDSPPGGGDPLEARLAPATPSFALS